MPFDFNEILRRAPDPELLKDVSDAAWADFGRQIHAHLLSERYLRAVTEAVMSAGGNPSPVQHIARKVRAFLFSGTITR